MNLGLEDVRPAVVAIDLHRGHLDMEVATLPAPADVAARVVAANTEFNQACRKLDIPIKKAAFQAETVRYADDLSRYININIEVEIEGVSQADAETLVQAYQDDCPIYRLASEGSEVSMKVTAK